MGEIVIQKAELAHIIEQIVYSEVKDTIGFSSYQDIAIACGEKVIQNILEENNKN